MADTRKAGRKSLQSESPSKQMWFALSETGPVRLTSPGGLSSLAPQANGRSVFREAGAPFCEETERRALSCLWQSDTSWLSAARISAPWGTLADPPVY